MKPLVVVGLAASPELVELPLALPIFAFQSSRGIAIGVVTAVIVVTIVEEALAFDAAEDAAALLTLTTARRATWCLTHDLSPAILGVVSSEPANEPWRF